MRISTIESPMSLKCGRIYWEVIQFKSRRNLRQWIKYRGIKYSQGVDGMTITWKKSRNLIATVLLCDEANDIEVLAHEGVHMARAYLRRFGRLKDEEALAYLTESIVKSLVWLRKNRGHDGCRYFQALKPNVL